MSPQICTDRIFRITLPRVPGEWINPTIRRKSKCEIKTAAGIPTAVVTTANIVGFRSDQAGTALVNAVHDPLRLSLVLSLDRLQQRLTPLRHLIRHVFRPN